MPRMIYKCKSKACGKVRAFDYPESTVLHMGYGRMKREYFRIAADGRKVKMGYESLCECGRYAISNQVKGFVSAHVCDSRCTGATGSNCECSCGGANHGSAHL